MKRILISTAAGVCGFFILYLVGCFACASFNIKTWSVDSRSFISIFGTIAFIGAFIGAYHYDNMVKSEENTDKIETLRIELKKLRDQQKTINHES